MSAIQEVAFLSASQVIDPIKSRCLCLRIAAPTPENIASVLHNVSSRENFALPGLLATKIVQQSNGNLRRALLALEVCKAQQFPLSAEQ